MVNAHLVCVFNKYFPIQNTSIKTNDEINDMNLTHFNPSHLHRIKDHLNFL